MSQPSHEQQLFDLLQGKPEPALQKEGQDQGELPSNEDQTTVGSNAIQKVNLEGREKGDIDARWGEEDGSKNKAVHHSSDVISQFREGREKLLDKLFDAKRSSDGAEQGLIGAHLVHGASGDFETSSPQLSSKSKLKLGSAPETLAEQVRRVVGRR